MDTTPLKLSDFCVYRSFKKSFDMQGQQSQQQKKDLLRTKAGNVQICEILKKLRPVKATAVEPYLTVCDVCMCWFMHASKV